MPLVPDFDLYEALEVPKNASAQDITASYRRLARVHHPDKNLDNTSATATFQKVQAAYEILSNERQRGEYDQPVVYDLSSGLEEQYNSREDYEDECDEIEEMMFDQFFHIFFTRASRRPNYDRSAEFEAEMERRERENRLRREAEAAWEANQAASRLERARRKKEKIEIEHKLKMELIFSANGCATDAEKQVCCEHCSFWPKEQMKKKFKCLTCGQKRGHQLNERNRRSERVLMFYAVVKVRHVKAWVE
ncbi:hypothetical protein BOTNAR_0381g00070 [Botryotinia narcissicola]|uniref:J domain-containing protein n=1 Tax=Botryotinia narcissicola TaxID=278944 RepID=A0A4Z1HPM7_9HELO|nr:hypothetical protein BOTNAR_0381g00070 [Botryotinia narcissicola]